MKIVFRKISNEEHSVHIMRSDGSTDSAILNSRSFLRHDLAHLAVESEVPLIRGYWGSVAAGASLTGLEIRGPDIATAESLSGPVQTLMRVEADEGAYFAILLKIRPDLATTELASRIREKGRQLQGHWKATAFGGEMVTEWDDSLSNAQP